MSNHYENWERLVRVVLRREHDRELARRDSRDASSIDDSSLSSSSKYDCFDESFVPQQNNRAIPTDYSDITFDHREWKAMLPPGQREKLYKSASMMFFLDSRLRKNCFLLGANSLLFSDENCKMEAHPKSRFSDVVVPMRLLNLDIRGRIYMKMLSPKTLYGAYIVFGLDMYKNNTTPCLMNAVIKISYEESGGYISEVKQDKFQFQLCEDRSDGWKEIKLGTFYVHQGMEAEVEVLIVHSTGPLMEGLVVEGIEFRPREGPPPELLPKQEEKGWTLVFRPKDSLPPQLLPEQEVKDWTLDGRNDNDNFWPLDAPESWRFERGR